jgi:FixJ family two-component response regulator
MPDMNGSELAKQLAEIRPDMKPLFMSGYADNIIADQGVLREGTYFIQKPFSRDEIANKVRAALGGIIQR